LYFQYSYISILTNGGLFYLIFNCKCDFNTRTILNLYHPIYTSQECINRFIYFVYLGVWYFYNPVAFLLLFQFSFLILKTCSVPILYTYIHTRWILVKHKAIILEVFWRKFYDSPTLKPPREGEKMHRPKEGGICPFAFYEFRAIFRLGVCVYV